jgi:hypothetical protein
MIFFVRQNYLERTFLDKITFESFELLTGKKIDFSKRHGTIISLERRGGHLYIKDEHPIVGEVYKLNGKKYICSLLTSTSETVLSEIGQKLSIVRHVGEIEVA